MPRRLYAAAATGFLWACSAPVSNPVAAATNVNQEQVHFRNADITLAGTLFLPARSRVHPAVMLFHGSGPEPRNLFMGRWFAEQGFAALAYDKRGGGGSTGDFEKG